MLIAAPKILGEIEVLKQEEPKQLPNVVVGDKIIPGYVKKGFWFKVSTVMMKDAGYTEQLFNDEHSFLWRGCKNAGIDLNKPFEFTIGFEEDDFTRTLRTGAIIQRIPV